MRPISRDQITDLILVIKPFHTARRSSAVIGSFSQRWKPVLSLGTVWVVKYGEDVLFLPETVWRWKIRKASRNRGFVAAGPKLLHKLGMYRATIVVDGRPLQWQYAKCMVAHLAGMVVYDFDEKCKLQKQSNGDPENERT